jgi:hypothetical protein
MITEPHTVPLNIVVISPTLEDSLEAQISRRKAFFSGSVTSGYAWQLIENPTDKY